MTTSSTGIDMAEMLTSMFGPPEQLRIGTMVFRPARLGERPDGYYSNRWEGIDRAPIVRVEYTWMAPTRQVLRWPRREKRAIEMRRARIALGRHHRARWGQHG